MILNCKKIIVTSIKVSHHVFADYVDEFRSLLETSLPNAVVSDVLKVVPEENFVTEVLADPQNIGICYTEVGMKQSSYLNRFAGIRAAIVHNKYIAYMCRRHNDANVCVFGIDCLGMKLCSELALSYATSYFDHEERNMLRIAIMADYDKQNDKIIKPKWKQNSFCFFFKLNRTSLKTEEYSLYNIFNDKFS